MTKYADKIAKQKEEQKETSVYTIADFQVNGNPQVTREITHEISYLSENEEMFKREVDVLHFTDSQRRFIVNTFNAEILIELFGDEPVRWAGQRVTLFLEPYGWQNKVAIRVKAADTSKPTGSAPSVPTQSRAPAETPKKSLKEDMSDEVPF